MNETGEKMDSHFFQLVISLQGGAMQQMGKIASPLTGKIERNLDLAKNSIDMLAMIRDKTEGNLSEEERKLIEHVLYELRLNYVDELKKPAESASENKPDSAEDSGENEESSKNEQDETKSPDKSPGETETK